MVTLTKALAVELGPLGIRVNAVRAALLAVLAATSHGELAHARRTAFHAPAR